MSKKKVGEIMLSRNVYKRQEHAQFYDCEDSDDETTSHSPKTYLVASSQNSRVAGLEDIWKEQPSTTNTINSPKLRLATNTALVFDTSLPSNGGLEDDLDRLLHLSTIQSSNSSSNKNNSSVAFGYVDHRTVFRRLVAFLKRLHLFLRGKMISRRKRRYSFDVSSSDFQVELSSANNNDTQLKKTNSHQQPKVSDGVKAILVLVMLVCILCTLWAQILQTNSSTADPNRTRRAFRSRFGIRRVTVPVQDNNQEPVSKDAGDQQLANTPNNIAVVEEIIKHGDVVAAQPELLPYQPETEELENNQEQVADAPPVDVLPSAPKEDAGTEYVITIPSSFDNLANFPSERQPGDIPVFWHIPKSGGSTIKDILAGCFQITIADEMGAQFGHAEDKELEVFMEAGNKFINVDSTNPAGIAKAKALNLASSGLVDAIVTSYVHEASELFSASHRARFFTVMRDPIERAVSMHGYLGRATWEANYDPAFATMPLEKYAQSDKVENNWMTRFLSNQMTGEVTESHLAVAKEILRTKFVVGIMKEFNTTMIHFEKYFEWQIINRPHRMKCVENMVSGGSNRHRYAREHAIKGSQAYSLLHWQNQLDVKLYHYAQQLFQEQCEYFDKIPRPTTGTLK